jgi:hypothetical protein
MTTSEKPLPKSVANLLGEMEECTEQILGSAEIIARIYEDDEDTALDALGRVVGALQVTTFFLMREEDAIKHPELEEERAALLHAKRKIEQQAAGES